MVTSEQKKTGRPLPALVASVLLHGSVLYCLGAVGIRGPAAEPSVMAVYLAMPADVPVRAVDRQEGAFALKKIESESTQDRTDSTTSSESENVNEPYVSEIASLLNGSGPEKPASKEIPQSSQEENNTPAPNHPSGKREQEQDKTADVQKGTDPWIEQTALAGSALQEPVEDPGYNDPGNHQSSAFANASRPASADRPITVHQSPVLAFAGDPAALGKIVQGDATSGFADAAIISLPEPAYPILSRKRGEEGRVVLEVSVSAQGEVNGTRIKASSSFARLDRAALAAAGKATFTPAFRFGSPVESVATVAYRFELTK